MPRLMSELVAFSMASFTQASHDIAIADHKSLTTDKLICERIPLGEADDYKPCIARLPSGKLGC